MDIKEDIDFFYFFLIGNVSPIISATISMHQSSHLSMQRRSFLLKRLCISTLLYSEYNWNGLYTLYTLYLDTSRSMPIYKSFRPSNIYNSQTPRYLIQTKTLTYSSNLSFWARIRSARFVFLRKSLYSMTLFSAQTHPPNVIAAICRNTLNCGVRPR